MKVQCMLIIVVRFGRIDFCSSHGGVWGSGGIAPRILNLCARWSSALSFTPGRFTPGKRAPQYPRKGGWVDFTAGRRSL